ncbi:hypothetical protein ACFX1Q_043105 [Malus domestica]
MELSIRLNYHQWELISKQQEFKTTHALGCMKWVLFLLGIQKRKPQKSMNFQITVTLFSVLACIVLSVNSAFTPSIVTDKEALIAFKSMANVPPTFWNQSSSPSANWTGVSCN